MTAEYRLIPEQEHIEHVSDLLVNRIKEDQQILLDLDGVVLKSDSLQIADPTTFGMLPVLRDLEAKKVRLGLATMRGMHAISYLRKNGLQLQGDKIIEGGHVLLSDEGDHYLGHPNHRNFIQHATSYLENRPNYRKRWINVLKGLAPGLYCRGNIQWQGENRASWWINTDQTPPEEMLEFFTRLLEPIAAHSDLLLQRDVGISVSQMKKSPLGIIGVKGRLDGEKIDKSTIAQFIKTPWSFVGDGFGDTNLCKETVRGQGIVIGVGGNLDRSDEVDTFMQGVTVKLQNPHELEQVFRRVVKKLPS
ncbi:MAG: hypothetical protein ACEQSA_03165 [Weeksellaceae bacterium]